MAEIKKAKTTDDLKATNLTPTIRPKNGLRSRTTDDLDFMKAKPPIRSKDGHSWKAVTSRPDPLSLGDILTFRMPAKQIEEHNQKTLELYPAVEASIYECDDSFNGPVINKLPDNFSELETSQHFSKGDDQLTRLYNFLGFGSYYDDASYDRKDPYAVRPEGKYTYIEVPDYTALTTRWALLKEQYPELPELDILLAPGIAGNIDFIEAYFTHDALCSNGIEFFHDMMAHVKRTIEFIWKTKTAKDYQAAKYEHAKLVLEGYKYLMAYKHNIGGTRDKISFSDKEFELLETSVGLAADYSSARTEKRATFAVDDIPRFDGLIDQDFTENDQAKLYYQKLGFLKNEDVIEHTVNWIKLQLATAHLFGLPEIFLPAAEIMMEDANNGAYLLSKESLYIKTAEGIQALGLKIIDPWPENKLSGTYEVTTESGETLRFEKVENGQLSAADIDRLLNPEPTIKPGAFDFNSSTTFAAPLSGEPKPTSSAQPGAAPPPTKCA